MIRHHILLRKYSEFDIHPSLLRWIAAFLQGRSQFVKISNSTSKTRSSPRDELRGPILFSVMVNDLASSWAPRTKFVDDLTILEIVPRNSPSVLNFIVDDIQSFAVDIANNIENIQRRASGLALRQKRGELPYDDRCKQ